MTKKILIILLLAICNCSTPTSYNEEVATHRQSLIDIIVDNADSGATVISGNWGNATAASEHYGSMSLYATTGGSLDTFRFTPILPEEGTYEVFAWNSCYSNRGQAVPHTIYDGVSSSSTVLVDQDCDTGSHGEWYSLGNFWLTSGQNAYIEISDSGVPSNTYIGADAVRFVTNGTGGMGGMGGEGGGMGGMGGSPNQGGAGGQGGVGGSSFGIDLFNGNSLDSSWNTLNDTMFGYNVQIGQLSMEVNTNCSSFPYCAWFNETQGPLLYKSITGNFKARTLVRVRKTSNPLLAPNAGVQLAGIIARDPNNTVQNYVFTVSGYRQTYLSNETKSTIDNVSNVTGPAYVDQSSADRELQLCRFDENYYVYVREVGNNSWTLSNQYDRSSNPLPSTLQVGLTTYTYDSFVDITGYFDYFLVEEISSATECAN